MSNETDSRGDLSFFLGCIMPNRYPQIEKTTRYVMEKLGYNLVDMEKATCCPAPGVFRSFNKPDWMVMAARNLTIAEKNKTDLITVCNGCFGTLMDVNKHLKTDKKMRNEVNDRLDKIGDYEFKGDIGVRHIGELLGFEIGPTEIQKYLVRKVDAKCVIHYGCHFLKPARVRKIQDPESPNVLEDYVSALGAEPLSFKNQLTCCGAGGGVKAYDSATSMTILAEKLDNMAEVKPDFILDICPFCHLQFDTGQGAVNQQHGTEFDIPVIHISQLTAYCMGLDEKYLGLKYQSKGKVFKFKSKPIEGA